MEPLLQSLFVPGVVLGVAILMMVVELTRPGRDWPKVAGWYLRAALLNGIQVGMVILAVIGWDKWMMEYRPWSADALGTSGGAIVGYLVITFAYYWWHLARHKSDYLWRWFHQVHHSPQRIEIITSFYKHPVELVTNSLITSAILYLVVGLSPQAAAYAILLSGLGELVYHWNVTTPYWVGFIFQRPESHCVHHMEGVHSYNYSDLPIWDMLFGTFRNPKEFRERCGLGAENEPRLKEMLLGVDVSKSPVAK